MRIGLFGGTFNPIHYGHLILAQEALLQGSLEAIWLMPNGHPPHKQESDVDPEHRFRMTELAASEHPLMQVTRTEIDRKGVSYTYQTLEILCKEFPEHRFSFITGADALLNYEWKCFDILMSHVDQFLVATRAGFDPDDLEKKIQSLPTHQGVKIRPFPFPELELSSTQIRHRVAHGDPIRFWVPRSVESYIAEHKLYASH